MTVIDAFSLPSFSECISIRLIFQLVDLKLSLALENGCICLLRNAVISQAGDSIDKFSGSFCYEKVAHSCLHNCLALQIRHGQQALKLFADLIVLACDSQHCYECINFRNRFRPFGHHFSSNLRDQIIFTRTSSFLSIKGTPNTGKRISSRLFLIQQASRLRHSSTVTNLEHDAKPIARTQ